MRILIAIEDLRIGGAQTFALRLAQALHEAQHEVYLYNMYWQYTEHDLVKRLAPDIELIQYQPSNKVLDNFIARTDGWLQRHRIECALRAGKLRQHLRQVIQDKQIEVVNSNTFKADHLCAQVLRDLPRVPLIVTMHGDYEQFLAFYRKGKEYVIPGYLAHLTETVNRINGVAYLSDQNLEALQPEVVGSIKQKTQIRRIYNGLNGRFSREAGSFTRAALQLPLDALVFGMVARGVPEKGWEPVIKAFQQLQAAVDRPMSLVLVGEGDVLNQLQERYRHNSNIRFLGFVDNPIDCVASFDVGILASSLRESLPNSIAEYLFCGKPVISTDVGEIRQMIRTTSGQEAGLLIDFPTEGLADVDQLYQAMHNYATDDELLHQHQHLAKEAFEKFDIDHCIQEYTNLYLTCQEELAD